MNEKVLHTLEYTKIIHLLAEKASSEPGRAMCRNLTPMTDLSDIRLAQQQTADALSMLFAKGSTSFGGNHDLSLAMRRLEMGSSLPAPELLRIARLLENVARIKAYGRPARDAGQAQQPPRPASRQDVRQNRPRPCPSAPAEEPENTNSLTDYFQRLEPLSLLCGEINRCILSEEEIADDASPGLKHVRRMITVTGEKIHSQLISMVNGSCRSYLQDAVITMRDNRYCIPVKAEYKSQVPGMVHDQSSTGSTFFIEPAAVVNLNNQLKELAIKEKEEIEAVLADLSAQAGEHVPEITENQRIMTFLDFVFAKASLAMDQNATMPLFNTERYIRIRKGRHPLLPAQKVVPIDIHLGKDFDLLVVTGPNTGGKTVSLKTVGLFTLMGQAGLHIPALDRSELSVFTEVFADIGDEQSIEQSLSTFSSHMTSIVSILKNADDHSLCLFDELGAGTDPTEGAALAVAILDHLHTRGIRTMATTHYSELKVYALSTDFVENACCEFNVETLAPTYRLLIGIPGKSNAFAISSKLGLPDYIIDAARAQINTEDKSFEDLLTDLENNRITIEKERLEIASYKEEIEALKKKLQEKNERIDNAKDKILRQANEQAREILQEAKDVADETIRIYQKAGPGASLKDLEKTRERLRGEIGKKNEKLSLKTQPAKVEKKVTPDQIKVGDSVKILSMGLSGTVSTLPDHRGNLFVQCGALRSQANVKDLVLIPADALPGSAPRSSSLSRSHTGKVKMSKSLSISPEINLLGRTVDEALSELDKYLDDAYLAHLSSVRVVHGKGTGALRSAVHNHLKRVKYVKAYRLGEYGEGDAGVTIVTFKE